MSTQPPVRLRPFKPMTFGRYTLLSPLSTGGMGELFLARLEGVQGFHKLCVIKKIRPQLAQDVDFIERFVNEAKTLVNLSHGSIAQVLDMGMVNGEPYLALEYVDGKDLRRVAWRARDNGGILPLSFTLFVMERVLDALGYVHRKRGDDDRELNLVHRDLSPQNILVSYEGEVKIIDFGLAKSALNVSETHPNITLGTYLYMSPEQVRHKRVDRRSDLYAAGVCLYELVSGKNLFEAVPHEIQLERLMEPRFPPLGKILSTLPRPLEEALTQALAQDPTERFQTAEEFSARLRECAGEWDPRTGPEAAARLMRTLFDAEYKAERRLLSLLREQPVRDVGVTLDHDSSQSFMVPHDPRRLTLVERMLPSQVDTGEVPTPTVQTVTSRSHDGLTQRYVPPNGFPDRDRASAKTQTEILAQVTQTDIERPASLTTEPAQAEPTVWVDMAALQMARKPEAPPPLKILSTLPGPPPEEFALRLSKKQLWLAVTGLLVLVGGGVAVQWFRRKEQPTENMARRAAPSRYQPRGNSLLEETWQRVDKRFHRLKEDHPCATSRMITVCAEHKSVGEAMEKASYGDTTLDEAQVLYERVTALETALDTLEK